MVGTTATANGSHSNGSSNGNGNGVVRARQELAVVNGSVCSGVQDPCFNGAPVSNAGSECGGIEFTREDVQTLLNDKPKAKNKFNYKFMTSCYCGYFTGSCPPVA